MPLKWLHRALLHASMRVISCDIWLGSSCPQGVCPPVSAIGSAAVQGSHSAPTGSGSRRDAAQAAAAAVEGSSTRRSSEQFVFEGSHNMIYDMQDEWQRILVLYIDDWNKFTEGA